MYIKWVFLVIVFLNIVDCVFVMGEFILDIYYFKGLFKYFLCFIEIWIVFFVGLGFKGMLLLMGKIIIMSYKMKCIKFCLMYEFISVIVI